MMVVTLKRVRGAISGSYKAYFIYTTHTHTNTYSYSHRTHKPSTYTYIHIHSHTHSFFEATIPLFLLLQSSGSISAAPSAVPQRQVCEKNDPACGEEVSKEGIDILKAHLKGGRLEVKDLNNGERKYIRLEGGLNDARGARSGKEVVNCVGVKDTSVILFLKKR